MAGRFVLYGFIGWIAEVIFTGTSSFLAGSLRLTAYTYLWMFPIYGTAVFLEPLHDHIRDVPWPVRGFIWAGAIFVIEYLAGGLLHLLIGFCPWDYTGTTPFSVGGYIRLDFLPIWFAGGLIFERLHDYLDTRWGKVRVR
ncbi:MAG: hypothetical protein GXX09_09800 [Syntrophomonadaceae bacterium]|nr:hypothetical protein [Syntrophomonadaceae bacterium]